MQNPDTEKKNIRKFNILHPPLLAFFSGELYRDVALNWKGLGIGYLCFLTLLFIVPEMFKLQRDITVFLDEAAPKIISQCPTITIKSGKLSINEPSPYKIYYSDEQKPFVIIDTTKAYSSPKQADTFMYITESAAHFRRSEEEYSLIDISRIDDMVITHAMLYKWVDMFKQAFPFIISPFLYLFSFVYFLAQALMCTFIGLLIAKKVCPDLLYSQVLRLSVLALTPPVMLQIVHTLLEIEFAYSGPISLLFTLCYLYFGLHATADKQQR